MRFSIRRSFRPISSKKEEPNMKNTLNGKMLTQVFSVVLCAMVLVLLAATLCPYYTVSEPYHFILNPNPTPDHYTLTDVMWLDTKVITTIFEEKYANFDINNYVTNMVLSFIFLLATVVTSLWYAFNEYKHYPSMTSAIFTHICGILGGVFTLLGYLSNDMLDLGVPAFMYVRTIIIIAGAAVLVLAIVRFVLWLLTTIQLGKERAARLALL